MTDKRPAADTETPPAVDMADELRERVQAAARERTALRIVGGDTKAFYGEPPRGQDLAVGGHSGVVHYEPTELVITARAGTPLTALETTLAEAGQMLAFEPPHFGPKATLGGAVAAGLSGPRRPYAGAVRDFVLGTRVLTGKAQVLSFGGEVMKNVAGYDVSRLMCGALGTLGILLEVSLKVLPRPAAELTLAREEDDAETVLTRLNRWAGQPLPITAACYDGDRLYLRVSGTPRSVDDARARLGGEVMSEGEDFWRRLREQELTFFSGPAPLWRLSLSATAPPLDLPGKWLLDWGGAQRWFKSEAPAETIRAQAARFAGHATLFRGEAGETSVFHPLSDGLARIHHELKRAFDPEGILNPGRLYPDL